MLADGSLNLSTARLLSPHLRPDNFETLVAEARRRSKREVEALVARLLPRPDVAASVRRLPARAQTAPVPVPSGPVATVMPTGLAVESEAGASLPPPAAPDSRDPCPPEIAAAAPERPTHRPAITPLAPERYRVQFTIGAATHEMLRQAQELLRREIPDGDPGAIFERALTLPLEEVARKKLAVAAKPRHRPSTRTPSRHIPAPVKHHREPYAIGGEATVANISLRCRAHNVYEAELAFGPVVPASAMPRSPVPVVRETPTPYLARVLGPAAPPEPGLGRVNSPRGELLPADSTCPTLTT